MPNSNSPLAATGFSQDYSPSDALSEGVNFKKPGTNFTSDPKGKSVVVDDHGVGNHFISGLGKSYTTSTLPATGTPIPHSRLSTFNAGVTTSDSTHAKTLSSETPKVNLDMPSANNTIDLKGK
uniref:Uncharacterized protein n=1 Tax=Cannabis sativa TaxID=3483 RepID=A0A803QSM6_CANSA